MKIENLTEENVEVLQGVLSEMQTVNPNILWQTFPLPPSPSDPGSSPDPEISVLRREVAMLRQKVDTLIDMLKKVRDKMTPPSPGPKKS